MAISDQSCSDGDLGLPVAGAPLRLDIQELMDGGWHRLSLSGEMDLASSTLLDEAIERIEMATIDGIALDLSKVTFIDSTGVRAIIVLHKCCEEHGTDLQITSGSRVVQRIFAISGLLDVLPFVKDAPAGEP